MTCEKIIPEMAQNKKTGIANNLLRIRSSLLAEEIKKKRLIEIK